MRIPTRSIAVVAAALVFGVVLELAARIDDRVTWGAPVLSSPSLVDLQVVDETGVHGRPRAAFQKWRFNSLGLMGRETTRHRPPGAFRVVVLGASESMGLYESPGMSYPAQLERLLGERLDSPVEVLTAALPGMTVPRVSEFCRYHLGSLQPNVVVYYPNPVTYLADASPSEARPPVVTSTPGGRFAPRVVPKLVDGVNRAFPVAFQRWRLETGQARALASARRDRPDGWIFRELPHDRLQLFDRHLRSLVACFNDLGIVAILGTHAHRFPEATVPEDDLHLVAWQIFYPRAPGHILIAMDRAANAVIRRVASESGVHVAEIATSIPPGPAYFKDFVHFTNEGATLVARALVGAILALPPADKR